MPAQQGLRRQYHHRGRRCLRQAVRLQPQPGGALPDQGLHGVHRGALLLTTYYLLLTTYYLLLTTYTEYIEVRIAEPMYIVMVEFGASRGMGAIVGVKAKTPEGEWVELYKGKALINERTLTLSSNPNPDRSPSGQLYPSPDPNPNPNPSPNPNPNPNPTPTPTPNPNPNPGYSGTTSPTSPSPARCLTWRRNFSSPAARASLARARPSTSRVIGYLARARPAPFSHPSNRSRGA